VRIKSFKLFENFTEPDFSDLEDIFINITDMGFELDAFVGSFSELKQGIITYRDVFRNDIYGVNKKSLIINLKDIGSLVDDNLVDELEHVIKMIENMYQVEFRTLKVSQEIWLSIVLDMNLKNILELFKSRYISPFRKRRLNHDLDLFFVF
jgi:hypothetical protein